MKLFEILNNKTKEIRDKISRKNGNNSLNKLDVIQNGKDITISMSISNKKIKVSKLYIKHDNDIVCNCILKYNNRTFTTSLDLSKLTQSTFSELELGDLTFSLLISTTDKSNKEIFQTISLNKFKKTTFSIINEFDLLDKKITLGTSTQGDLIFINKKEFNTYTTRLNLVKVNKDKIYISGFINTFNHIPKEVTIVYMGRETGSSRSFKLDVKLMTNKTMKNNGQNHYSFKISSSFLDILDDNFESDIIDIYCSIKFQDINEVIIKRAGKPRYITNLFINSSFFVKDDHAISIVPYFTFKAKNLSLNCDVYSKQTFYYYYYFIRFFHKAIRFFFRNEKIWLIGEQPFKAQDTGFHFFQYLKKEHPEINAYYVIDKTSPEIEKVKKYNNYLIYKSKKHFIYSIAAKAIITSHHPDYLYPLKSKNFIKMIKAKRIFLQHGILGTKNMANIYGKNSSNFYTDLFLVSSKREQNIVINDLGYSQNEVKITGLSRFDKLLNRDTPLKNQILIIPTWRDWILSDYDFLESDYYKYWNQLITNSKLRNITEQYNLDIVLCLHPNMRNYKKYFTATNIKIINQGEVDVQQLLKESNLMITDYSSVGFDFSFLKKPLIYYQFDKERFFSNSSSHLDLDNDLPGPIAFSIQEVNELVLRYAKGNFNMDKEYILKSEKLFEYSDQKSCERIYGVIKEKLED
ncbi:CDP-glycerol glycerophosphotransferase family protein [Sporosarcina sp. G11-34]|uniref:CDP-glycerol glycerophosphotransferase family protein n=1 Tax=Sporosarcina sp. G11-34 TaxID=2849605 RepID=UPI0022A915EB|nr:CDP-glycerol glycerophosphotransferase family protein [Sporosarcina sp. G11-34]MCZ2258660.1 CDP-glycerol glycerophosphotransferase family protein [Sporosarcina sp. G11-34]